MSSDSVNNRDDGSQKEMFGFRAEQPLADSIHGFAEDNEMSKSDALKTLVRTGLESEELEAEIDELRGELSELRREISRIDEESDDGFFSRFF